jgi:hypothetical protein
MRWLAVLTLALAGCPTVDLGDTPSGIGTCSPAKGEAYFETVIWPTYIQNSKKSCITAGCHDQTGDGGALHFKTDPVDLVGNYHIAQVFLRCAIPMSSPLYTKPCYIDTHSGGQIFNCPSDPEAQAFLDWFEP